MKQPLEAESGRYVLTYDGRAVEVFGFHESARYHVRQLVLSAEGPDRKGRYEVTVGRQAGGGHSFDVEGEDWPAFAELIERARSDAGLD